jgi:hypothetical protein
MTLTFRHTHLSGVLKVGKGALSHSEESELCNLKECAESSMMQRIDARLLQHTQKRALGAVEEPLPTVSLGLETEHPTRLP